MMKIFTGDEATNIEKTAQDVIQAHLEIQLGGELYLSTFEPYEGVKILDDEGLGATPDEFSLKPQIYISVDDHKRIHWDGGFGLGRRHEITITAELLTNESNFGAEQKLRDAIATIIDDNGKALRLAGFFEASCDPNPSKLNDENKVNPLAISGALYTLR